MNIHPASLEFLKAIREKNSREYFASIRPLYEDILYNLKEVISYLAQELTILNPDFAHVDPAQCMFRIYRDARRLKPGDYLYKYHRGIVIGPEGTHSHGAWPYIQLSPGGSFIGGGIRRRNTATLYKIRTYLSHHGDEFINIINGSEFQDYFGTLQGKKLIGSPRGFTKETPHIDLIKHTQFLVQRHYNDEEVLSETFVDEIIENVRQAQEFYEFLNKSLQS